MVEALIGSGGGYFSDIKIRISRGIYSVVKHLSEMHGAIEVSLQLSACIVEYNARIFCIAAEYFRERFPGGVQEVQRPHLLFSVSKVSVPFRENENFQY